MKSLRSLLLAGIGIAGLTGSGTAASRDSVEGWGAPTPSTAARSPGARPAFGSLPLVFAENRGQADPRVAFHAWGRDRAIFLCRDGLTFGIRDRAAGKRWTVKLDFLGARPAALPEGLDPAPTVVSWFRGPRAAWKTGVPTWSSVVYRDLWPGVDLVCAGKPAGMKYEFRVRPGADPARIRLGWRGAASVALDAAGRLAVGTPAGGFRDERPVSWQEVDGRRVAVETSYELSTADGGGARAQGFRLGAFDRTRALVIDPAVLVYCGYLGDGVDEADSAIAVDGSGNAYVGSRTYSSETTFPVLAGPDLTANGGADAIVAKVNAAGTALVYCGFIGGAADEEARGIAVDASGNAYLAGRTASTEATFPVLGGPSLVYAGGAHDAFVAKVNAAGTALVYCGYVGGAADDGANGIAVDGSGEAFLSGTTGSDETTFPVVGGPDQTFNGGTSDAFVARVGSTGMALDYCGYIGGAGNDTGTGVAVDTAGAAYVVGETDSAETSFPVAVGPDLTQNGGRDAFVAKVAVAGTSLDYCGYIGGSGNESSPYVAVTGSGSAFVSGATFSDETTFPVAVGPDLTFNGGSRDGFVARVLDDGTGLAYCGYIGGAGFDAAYGVAVDGSGRAWVAGYAGSGSAGDFPVADGPDLTANGSDDWFVARVLADGSALDVSGYVGGSSSDYCIGIAVDAAGDAYVTGYTFNDETTFPVVRGPDVTFNGSGSLTFLAKVSLNPVVAPPAIESFILPKKIKVKLDATDNSKSTLVTAGFLDTGPDADPDFVAAATVTLGGLSIPVDGLVPNASGTVYSYSGAGLLFQVKTSKTGSSKAVFRVKYQGDLSGQVDPDAPVTLSFDNGTVDGTGEVGLEAGVYALGKKRGSLVAPNLYLYKVKAVLKGAGEDGLTLKAGIATGGTTPDTAPAVTVGFGDTFSATIPSESFTRNGDRYEFRGDQGGITQVILDYLRETVTVKGKGLDLGTFAAGPVPVLVTVGIDGDSRSVRVRMGRKGTALVY